jgi:cell shape-determining protein MreC
MNRSLTFFTTSALLFLLSFIVIFLEQAGFSGFLQKASWWLLQPGQRVGAEWRFAVQTLESQRQFFLHGGKLLGQLEFSLQQEKSDRDNVELLRKENELLRFELGDKTNEEYGTFTLSGWREKWIIGGGCLDGVKKDAPVLFEGSLVGQVVEVQETSSVVATLFDQAWRVPVAIGTGSTKALLDTSRGTSEITEISGNIEVNDVVMTAGIGGLPPNIPIGRVGEIHRRFGKGVLESALLEPYFLPNTLRFVQTHVEEGSTCEVV